MIKKIEGLCTLYQRDYIEAENKAHDNLMSNGYLPQGADKGFKTVCVMRIENEHSNNEKREVLHFQNWQEASETLCIGEK